jgi:hypothetical protein
LGIAALALTLSAAHAETLINTDFSKDAAGWVLNQDAQLLDPKTAGVTQVLSLTQNDGSQTGVAWTEITRRVPSFSFIVDMRIRFQRVVDGVEYNECPADGATLVFAEADSDWIGPGGGSLGLFGGGLERYTSFVVNTWRGAGNGNAAERESCTTNLKFETFEFGVIAPGYGEDTRPQDGVVRTPADGGSKINQVNPPEGMRLVNGGWYRYQWNVDGATNTMSVYITGLEEGNSQFQKVKAAEIKSGPPVLNFSGRWGISGATGGAVQFTEVRRARIDVPMIDPL